MSAGVATPGRSVVFYAGYSDLARDIRTLAAKLPEGCDGVAGVPNSGLLPAKLLAEAYGAPLYEISDVPDTVQRLVVVEDATQFVGFKAEYSGLAKSRAVVWTGVYACGAALSTLDAYAVEAPKPRVFAWNLHKHPRYTRTFMFDIDGIVCRDPVGDEYSEPAYSRFIQLATPLLPPMSRQGTLTGEKPAMGTFVTGRKERYRAATEEWLRQHIGSWQGLIMRPDDAERGTEAIAEFKADAYKRSKATLFVESSEVQAQIIHARTHKPVVCLARGFGTRSAPVDMCKPVLAGNTKVIYTIATGKYADVQPEQFDVPPGWDYVRITDKDCPYYLTPKQKAAWAKINAPRLFKQYACSLCIDDDISVLQDPTPVFCHHEWTAISRRHPATLAEDLVVIVKARRATTQDKVDAEWARYAREGVDKNGPVWISNVMFRQHTDRIRRVCDEWWWWYTQSETQRDQPSMCAAIQLTGVAPHGLREKEDLADYTRHRARKADEAGVRVRI